MSVADLIAEDAIYHRKCYQYFFKLEQDSTGQPSKVGRPTSSEVTSTMQKIFEELENSEECQFSINDLLDKIGGYVQENKREEERRKEKTLINANYLLRIVRLWLL